MHVDGRARCARARPAGVLVNDAILPLAGCTGPRGVRRTDVGGDLSAHLVFGIATRAVFAALDRE